VIAPDFDKCFLVAGILMSDAITVADLNGCETGFSPPIAAMRQGSYSLPVDFALSVCTRPIGHCRPTCIVRNKCRHTFPLRCGMTLERKIDPRS
jgi:hypothetical protein